jgi:hypothetical protein
VKVDEYQAGLEVARDVIPARVRRWIYALASLVGLVMTAVVVGFTTAGVEVPSWVTLTLAVLGALMTPLGLLAAANTSTGGVAPPPAELWPADDVPPDGEPASPAEEGGPTIPDDIEPSEEPEVVAEP